jgi:hypothetical protein
MHCLSPSYFKFNLLLTNYFYKHINLIENKLFKRVVVYKCCGIFAIHISENNCMKRGF